MRLHRRRKRKHSVAEIGSRQDNNYIDYPGLNVRNVVKQQTASEFDRRRSALRWPRGLVPGAGILDNHSSISASDTLPTTRANALSNLRCLLLQKCGVAPRAVARVVAIAGSIGIVPSSKPRIVLFPSEKCDASSDADIDLRRIRYRIESLGGENQSGRGLDCSIIEGS